MPCHVGSVTSFYKIVLFYLAQVKDFYIMNNMKTTTKTVSGTKLAALVMDARRYGEWAEGTQTFYRGKPVEPFFASTKEQASWERSKHAYVTLLDLNALHGH